MSQKQASTTQARPQARAALAAALFATAAPAVSAPLTPQDDKISHLSVSATGTAAIIKVFQLFDDQHVVTPLARIVAGGVMAAAGIAKEANDVRRGGRKVEGDSAGDLGADATGIVLGQFLLWEF